MMRRKVKGMLCALVMGICVCGTTLTAYADTVHFSITMPGDTVSKRTRKADNEQRFYVTGTSFHQNGTLNCESIKIDDDSVRSEVKGISPAHPKANGVYKKRAPYNKKYYMATSSSTKNLHVCGNYTP
jgi:uncharacterized Zn finger protein